MKLSEPPRLGGGALQRHLRDQQRQWIAYCEANGRSYAGPNGPAIRQADEAELHRLETILNQGRQS